MPEPPSLAGMVQLTVACWLSVPAAVTICGALGVVAGVTAFDVPTGLVPALLMAATWKVYVVPFVSPVATKVVGVGLTVQPGCAVFPIYGVTV